MATLFRERRCGLKQHPKAKAAGITPGEWKESAWLIKCEGKVLFDVPPAYTSQEAFEQEANRKLAIDAGNAMNNHGHTPSEMVEIIRELRATLKEVADCSYTRHIAKSILTKTEDFQ